ncbi:MAG: GTP cyclohydrolase I FolE, partial [Moorea sp. SIO2B7]|nr:GTP cyclohydrolase I FolE [Moorena sp. SIO2B7]
MTIASSNGFKRVESVSTAKSINGNENNQLETRPDRNTQNGHQPNLQPPLEELNQEMINAVSTILLGVGEDPQRE